MDLISSPVENIALLHQRIAELEACVAAAQHTEAQLAALQRQYDRLSAAVNSVASGISISDPSEPDCPLVYVNKGFTTMTGYTAAEVIGRNCRFLQGPLTDRATVQAIGDAVRNQRSITVEVLNHRKDGTTFWNELTIDPIYDAAGKLTHFVGLQSDITSRKQAEQEQTQLKDEMIRMQAAMVAELSTPLLPLNDRVVVMPIIGNVDGRRAQQVISSLLNGVNEHRARIALLDITGVRTVDTHVANTLIQAAQAVRLLGADVVLTGVRPEVAQTLVQLGVDLRSIITLSSLQSGIAFALAQR